MSDETTEVVSGERSTDLSPEAIAAKLAKYDPGKHCGAKTNPLAGALPCLQAKGMGTDHLGSGHCKLHAGTSKNGRTHAAREAASNALARLGQPIATNPQQALLDLVSEAAGNVAFLRVQVGNFGEHLTMTASKVSARSADGDVEVDGELTEFSGNPITIREDVRAVIKLYGEWCDRLAKYAAEAIKAGIAEREIALIEAQADMVARVIVRALEGLPDDEFERRKNLAMDELVTFKAIPAGSRN